MKTQIQIEVGAFPVPDTVPILSFSLGPLSLSESPRIHIAPTVPNLAGVGDAFRAEVFNRAGKPPPPEAVAPSCPSEVKDQARNGLADLLRISREGGTFSAAALDDLLTPIGRALDYL